MKGRRLVSKRDSTNQNKGGAAQVGGGSRAIQVLKGSQGDPATGPTQPGSEEGKKGKRGRTGEGQQTQGPEKKSTGPDSGTARAEGRREKKLIKKPPRQTGKGDIYKEKKRG